MSSSVYKEDELPLLRSAFLVEQMNIDHPGFKIKCGAYTWKIHRRVLFHQSREKDLFRDRTGVTATSVDLGHDNPWMVARLLQFLYVGTYDVHYLESSGGRRTMACSLENILNAKTRADDNVFAADKKKDTNRNELEVHLMMCELAIKHEIPTLIDHSLHRAFHCHREEGAAAEILKKAHTVIGMLKITNDDAIRRIFAAYIADNRKEIDEETLRNWLRGDGTFAIEVLDYLTQRNRDLEQQAVLAKSPPNLKKRRPSMDLSGLFGQNTDGETVTTPILASRTIVEERRSVARA